MAEGAKGVQDGKEQFGLNWRQLPMIVMAGDGSNLLPDLLSLGVVGSSVSSLE